MIHHVTFSSGMEKDITIHTLPADQPWKWLGAGWHDLNHKPLISMSYGLAVVVIFAVATLLLIQTQRYDFALALAAGFVFVGPILAVNLYAISRRIEQRKPIVARRILREWKKNGGQVMAFGILLMLILIGWMCLALLSYATLFHAPIATQSGFFATLFSTEGLPFLSVFFISGLILTIITFAFSAIAVPLLHDQEEMDAINAALISFDAVRTNWRAMALWAVIIAALTGFGLLTFYLGLLVILPWLGHATWHAYRDMLGNQ